MTYKLPTFDSYFAVTMELPKLILVCPLLLCLAALSETYSSSDVLKTCQALCQGQKVIKRCESSIEYYDKVEVVDHANVIFICCLGYNLNSTGIDYISYEFLQDDKLKQLVGMLKEIQSPEMAATYAKCIRDCSQGGDKIWDVEEVKSCVNGTKNCDEFGCGV